MGKRSHGPAGDYADIENDLSAEHVRMIKPPADKADGFSPHFLQGHGHGREGKGFVETRRKDTVETRDAQVIGDAQAVCESGADRQFGHEVVIRGEGGKGKSLLGAAETGKNLIEESLCGSIVADKRTEKGTVRQYFSPGFGKTPTKAFQAFAGEVGVGSDEGDATMAMGGEEASEGESAGGVIHGHKVGSGCFVEKADPGDGTGENAAGHFEVAEHSDHTIHLMSEDDAGKGAMDAGDHDHFAVGAMGFLVHALEKATAEPEGVIFVHDDCTEHIGSGVEAGRAAAHHTGFEVGSIGDITATLCFGENAVAEGFFNAGRSLNGAGDGDLGDAHFSRNHGLCNRPNAHTVSLTT